MSMDIRSFFGRGAKPVKAPEQAKTPTVKRKALIISDDEDDTKASPRSSKQVGKDGSSSAANSVLKKRRVIESDDEEEEKSLVNKKAGKGSDVKQEKLKPVNVSDIFSSEPVKRVELPKIPKKKTIEPVEQLKLDEDDDDVIPVTPQPDKKMVRKDRNGNERDEKRRPEKLKVSPPETPKAKTPEKSKVSSPEKPKKVKKEAVDEPDVKSKKSYVKQKSLDQHSPSDENPSPKGSRKLDSSVSDYKEANESVLTDEERHERKRMSAILYQKFKNRQGPANPGSKEIPEGKPNCLQGMQFVITGVLESMERDECAQVIKDLGGKVVGAVSKKVTHMVVGDDAGPKKIAQAEDLGIVTLSEDALLDLIRVKSGQKPLKRDNAAKQLEETPSSSSSYNKRKESPKEEKETKKIKTEQSPIKATKESVKVNVEKSPARSPSKVTKLKEPVKVKEEKKSPRKTADTSIPELTDYQKDIQSVDNMAWVDKYKPTSTKQIIGQLGASSNVQKLTVWLSSWYKNNDGTKKHAKPNPWAKNDSGAAFKAALLSGPPGVGKTTTATLVCKELGFDTVEFNASDTRSKRLLKEEVSELLNSKSLAGYFGGRSDKVSSKHVLLMDEVDGMAGNEDRGGMQELIALIKESHIPIICMCNDRNHPKIRSLVNYCFDLRFGRPRVEQIKGAMMSVCFKEQLKLSPGVLEEIITGTGGDVRQTLNHLALYSAGKSMAAALSVDTAKKQADTAKKDIKIGPWDVIRKVFSAEDHKHMTLNDKADLFFHDYNIAPLFVQENYLKVQPKAPRTEWLDRIAMTADSLSRGDMVERRIRSNMAWTLLPVQAMYSSVMPGEFMEGHFTGQINFPGWLGKNSKATKRKRLAQEIHDHTRVATSGSRQAIRLDYAPHLLRSIVQPLQMRGSEGVHDSLEVIKEYRLLREDIDSLVELSTWPKRKSLLDAVDGKVKAALTRAYNKEIAPYTYSAMTTVKKKARDAVQDEVEGGIYGEEGEQDGGTMGDSDDEEKEDKIDDNAFIKIKKKATPAVASKASTSKATGAKGKKK
ncbi:replication factor C subunit 1 [Anopheles maculipalpis]|uniref:replication factor C subunit 1 n=1 Tax=Anopheles maculipalpis TaxID=1496333 RepID=UPI0021592C3E|nr:replication factor C subunit 1 [Anopheles maculipalpis]